MFDVVAPLDELLVGPQIFFDFNAMISFLPRAGKRDTSSASAEDGTAFDIPIFLLCVGSAPPEKVMIRVKSSRHNRVDDVL